MALPNFSHALGKVRKFVEKWGLFVLAVVLAVALFGIHVIHVVFPEWAEKYEWGEKTWHALGVFVALGVVYQILDIARDVGELSEKVTSNAQEIAATRQGAEDGMERLAGKLGGLTEKVAVFRREAEGNLLRLAEVLSPNLNQLSDIFKDLKRDAQGLYPIENLEMDWLGIDMAHAWDHLVKEFLKNAQIKRIKIRLLMISPAWSHDPPWLPAEVRDWRENSAKNVERINSWLSNELAIVESRDRKIDLEIKLYDRLPVAHGFYIKAPLSTCYMSFFRWEGANYWQYGWGQDKYWKIVGDVLPPASRDLLDIFVGQFEYLWRSSAAHVPPS